MALLVAKIAPWYIDGVIDNSGSALPSPFFILGREGKQCDYFEEYPHNKIEFFTKTLWSGDAASPYFFGKANYLIRILPYPLHLSLQARANPHTIFTSYHSAKDPFDTAKDKQNLFLALQELGFDAKLNLIKNESQIDGKFIKDLGHGMRMNDKILFQQELPLMLEKLESRKSPMQEIPYPILAGIKFLALKTGAINLNFI